MSGKASVNIANLRLLASSTNITAAAWVELDAVVAQQVSAIQVYNATVEDLELALGAAGAESTIMYIPAGATGYQSRSGLIPINIPKDARLSVQSLGGTASTGALIINLWG